MKLRQLVMEKAIVPGLKSSKRDECIGELLDALMKGGAFKPAQRDDFLKAVIKREKKGSTGFGHGVAVPHVKTLEVKKCVAAIGLQLACAQSDGAAAQGDVACVGPGTCRTPAS